MTDASLEFTERDAPTPQRFSFKGSGLAFFFLMLKNIFLTVITLGVYWFWANVQTTKFLYNSSYFQGSSFDYHATGMEKFFGFLKAVSILIAVIILDGIFILILRTVLGENIGNLVGGALFYLLVFLVIPFIIIGALRFRLSRTSFHGIRFQFLGDPKEFTQLFLKSVGLTIITFGIYTPWAFSAITTYIAQNTLYGNHAFDFRVKAEDLFFIYLKGFIFTPLTFGIYYFWFRANLHNFFWNNYYFQNGKTISGLTGTQILIIFFKSIGLILITIGIAIPWVILMNKKVLVESVSFSTTVDLGSISSIPLDLGSATIDNLGGDALDSFGSIVG